MLTPEPAGSPRTIHDYLRLGRFSATPLYISNAFAGAALAGPLSYSTDLLFVLLAMALVSVGGMYLDDVLGQQDREPSSTGPAWVVPIALFGVSLALLAVVGLRPFVAGVALIAVIIVYDAWHAGIPARSILLGLIRVLVYGVAFSAFAADPTWHLVVWCVVMVAYVAGLTRIPRTVPGTRSERYGPLGLILLPAAVGVVLKPLDVLVWSLGIAMVLWAAHSVSFAWRSSNRQIGGSVARLIAGISLIDAIVLATREEWWGALLAMACLALTMMFQRALRVA